jgi:hypothetical protein
VISTSVTKVRSAPSQIVSSGPESGVRARFDCGRWMDRINARRPASGDRGGAGMLTVRRDNASRRFGTEAADHPILRLARASLNLVGPLAYTRAQR